MSSIACRKAVSIIFANVERIDDLKSVAPYSPAFDQMIYSRASAFEIIKLLSVADAEDPISIIEKFIAKMDQYSVMEMETSYMFSCMYDSATNLLDVVLGNLDTWIWY